MPRMSKNRFEVDGDTITIMHDGWDELAFATYREDYFDELSTHTWGLKNGYLHKQFFKDFKFFQERVDNDGYEENMLKSLMVVQNLGCFYSKKCLDW